MHRNRYNISIKDIIALIMAFLIILNHSVYYHMTDYPYVRNAIQLCWGLTILGWLFSTKLNKTDIKTVWKYLSIYNLLNMVYAFSKIDNLSANYIIRYVYAVPAMVYILYVEGRKNNNYLVIKYISEIMSIGCVISVVFWILGSQLNIIAPTRFIDTDWGGAISGTQTGVYSYFGIYFQSHSTIGSISKYIHYRNSGIFCEGPAFATFICLSLLYEFFLREKFRCCRIIVNLVALITTLSTTGFVFMLIVILIKWYYNPQIKKQSRHLIFYAALIFTFVIIACVIDNKAGGSIMNRKLDFERGMSAFFSSPLFGYGYNVDFYDVFHAGFSNAVTPILMRGGIVFFIIVTYPFIKLLLIELKKNKPSKIEIFDIAMSITIIFLLIVHIIAESFMLLFFLSLTLSRIITLRGYTSVIAKNLKSINKNTNINILL